MQEKKLNVLSLFDGISCGRVALERANIKVDNYYSSEIDKYAIQISNKNYPDIIRLGNVKNIDTLELPQIDLLIGGSPCQSFSFAGKMNGMTTKDNVKITTLEQYLELKNNNFEFDGYSYLFWEYVRILRDLKPKYFLLENVKMKKEWQDVISKELNVEPIMINSNLVSAQNRKRLYWTNIPNIIQPEDKHIYLKDIIDEPENIIDNQIMLKRRGHGYLPTIEYMTEKLPALFCSNGDYFVQNNHLNKEKINGAALRNQVTKRGIEAQLNIRKDEKSNCVVSSYSHKLNGVFENNKYRKLTPIECEKLQTLPLNYTDKISDTQRFKCIGNGWTVDVIAHIFKNIK